MNDLSNQAVSRLGDDEGALMAPPDSTWAELLPVLLSVMSNGTPTARVLVEIQLLRMAGVADLCDQLLAVLQNKGAGDSSEATTAVLSNARELAAKRRDECKFGINSFVLPPTKQCGQQAKTLLGRELELQVCESGAGFYIGTLNDQGLPCTRESEQYFRTRKAALTALDSGNWTQRPHP
jgi:hypothetical protein